MNLFYCFIIKSCVFITSQFYCFLFNLLINTILTREKIGKESPSNNTIVNEESENDNVHENQVSTK